MKAYSEGNWFLSRYWRLKGSDRGVLSGLFVSLAGLIFFIVTTTAVIRFDSVTAWDTNALQWLHSRTSPFGIGIFSAITFLGQTLFLDFLGVVIALLLVRKHQVVLMVGWIVALIGGEMTESVLKLWIRRPRPEFAFLILNRPTFSLPSGHAMNSTIAYSMLAYVLVSVWKPGRAAEAGMIIVAALLVIGIGFSRIYLGVHYISDVVAGISAGMFWFGLCVSATTLLRTRPTFRKDFHG
jgi:undecaprenyl-diphosphatase